MKPLVIPSIAWSSAPPPIPPRSFETAPPPAPPPSPVVATEAPPAMREDDGDRTTSPPGIVGSSDWDDETRVQPDDIRRALGVREDAPLDFHQMLEEALAPLHVAVRDLERRLGALEHAPPPAAARPPAAAPPPAAAYPPSVEVNQHVPAPGPAPADATGGSGRMNLDVFGAVVAAPRPVAAPPARAPSFDIEIPFDGARRRRRIALLFAIFVVLIFAALFGALISSRVSGS